jgi:geranylgeranyl diphosphate synthase type I
MAKTPGGPALPAMFARYRDRVEQELFRSVPSAEDGALYTLLRYHLGWVDRHGTPAEFPTSQGKVLRPTLCLFACEALEGDLSWALPTAASLELIHNFSLIHDDIQDRDLERRHQPTVWSIWGIPKALVAGNALQSAGDAALLDISRLDVAPQAALKVSRLLTESYLEMIQGQCLDLAFESSTTIGTQDYLQMIACKTGALIRTGLEIGASLATDDPATLAAFSRFGGSLGRVFQIRDDYLGIWGDTHLTGKPEVSDIRRRKKSYPVVFALERAEGQSRHDLLRVYSQEELDEEDVYRVQAILEEVGAREHTQSLVETSAQEALAALEYISLAPWAEGEAEALVDFLARREF